ncbi:hypothetical protein EV421DRAFT_1732639 [Armillaria borealis]|uniref:Uncharacterized protein n=1 Tax=Armillaria borealis TaxID=47425 RepID=A0AA39JV62_9AGAR|nr:hypothetical protein EV421DRAFT_1732639 [Armillaria borealis]
MHPEHMSLHDLQKHILNALDGKIMEKTWCKDSGMVYWRGREKNLVTVKHQQLWGYGGCEENVVHVVLLRECTMDILNTCALCHPHPHQQILTHLLPFGGVRLVTSTVIAATAGTDEHKAAPESQDGILVTTSIVVSISHQCNGNCWCDNPQDLTLNSAALAVALRIPFIDMECLKCGEGMEGDFMMPPITAWWVLVEPPQKDIQ